MTRIDAQEFRLPLLHPAEPWKESGRWDSVGDELFRLRDRKQTDMALAMTAEEIFTTLARDGLRSYRQLPQIWYQIGTKFRDEPRPKSGVLRGREFTMKDSYSFDADAAGLDVSFQKHADAYRRIFSRCGVESIPVQASSGAMGGSESVEFMAVSDAGEDWIGHVRVWATPQTWRRRSRLRGRRSAERGRAREVPDAGRAHHRRSRAHGGRRRGGAADQDARLRRRRDARAVPAAR
jgi:prolyl-tRNA synthetase